jgi:hypothetical protein
MRHALTTSIENVPGVVLTILLAASLCTYCYTRDSSRAQKKIRRGGAVCW